MKRSEVSARVRGVVEGLASRLNPDPAAEQPFGERSVTDEITDLMSASGLSAEDACDAFALELASGFNDHRYSFELCDEIVNSLYNWILVNEGARDMPTTFWRVFDAFDAGEFHHPGDASDVDPVERYTRPTIRDVLGTHD